MKSKNQYIYECRRSWSEMSGRSPEAGTGLDFGAGLITMIIIHYMSVRADLMQSNAKQYL